LAFTKNLLKCYSDFAKKSRLIAATLTRGECRHGDDTVAGCAVFEDIGATFTSQFKLGYFQVFVRCSLHVIEVDIYEKFAKM